MTATIYQITNLNNKKFYIGSANNFCDRKRNHLLMLRKNKHHNSRLQNSYNLHGEDSFIIEPLFYCFPEDKLKYEQQLLDETKPQYNIALFASAPMQGRKHSLHTKEKFKLRVYPKGENHPRFGTKLPSETITKMSESRRGSRRSEETRKKMSETAKRISAINRVDRQKQKKKIVDSEGNIHESLISYAKFWDMSVQAVCVILKGRTYKSRKGIRFFYETT